MCIRDRMILWLKLPDLRKIHTPPLNSLRKTWIVILLIQELRQTFASQVDIQDAPAHFLIIAY